MGRRVKPGALGDAIEQELSIYYRETTEKVNDLSKQAAKDLVKMTKASAPVGARGSFKKNIASKRLRAGNRGDTYVWYVKAPDYRLTHLLVHGHVTRDGYRTRPNSFLLKALNQVLPKYEADVEEAIKNG